MIGRRQAVARGGALVAVAMLAACGTRLPDSAFTSAPRPPASSSAPTSSAPASGEPIKVGLIVSKSSPLGSETFSGPMYGAQAYFKALNERGAVKGRPVDLTVCDDQASGGGNQDCVHKLIDDDHVIAFAGNSIFDYAGAAYVNSRDVPDVGGIPISLAYDTYQHLYSLYGSDEPRDGTVGFDGTLYGGTEVYRWFKDKLGAKVAGVVYYNQQRSAGQAAYTAKGLKAEGYTVVMEQVDFSLPNFGAAAIDMKSRGVDIVFGDAMDITGNVGACQAMSSAGLAPKALVTNVQNWSEQVRKQFASVPNCRNVLYSTAGDRNYMDTKYQPVKEFRDAMARYYPDRADLMSMWELEGWASAQWLTDAMNSCGDTIDAACIEAYMNRDADYGGHGLLTPRNFVPTTHPGGTAHNCLNVARWQDSAYGGKGGWVTQAGKGASAKDGWDCFDVPSIPYKP